MSGQAIVIPVDGDPRIERSTEAAPADGVALVSSEFGERNPVASAWSGFEVLGEARLIGEVGERLLGELIEIAWSLEEGS